MRCLHCTDARSDTTTLCCKLLERCNALACCNSALRKKLAVLSHLSRKDVVQFEHNP